MKFISDYSDRWKTAIVILILVITIGLADNGLLTWLFLGVVGYYAIDESMKLLKIEDIETV